MSAPRWLVLSLFAASVAAAGPLEEPTLGRLQGAAAAQDAVRRAEPEGASERAREAFDEPIDPAVFAPPSPAPVPADAPPPRPGLVKAKGDFVVGSPQEYREPKNPLTREDKPKARHGGFLLKLLGAAIGAALGGVVGFFLGGPVGAALGAAAGGIGGWFVTHG
ncbi:MAG: hypothetical protein HY553_10340 [Elusimicrobia bacterium]|nr:hypothetical protein [Elusimicrobiota bacterium]